LGSEILNADDHSLLSADAEAGPLAWKPGVTKRTKKKKNKKEHGIEKKARAHTQTHAHMYMSC